MLFRSGVGGTAALGVEIRPGALDRLVLERGLPLGRRGAPLEIGEPRVVVGDAVALAPEALFLELGRVPRSGGLTRSWINAHRNVCHLRVDSLFTQDLSKLSDFYRAATL